MLAAEHAFEYGARRVLGSEIKLNRDTVAQCLWLLDHFIDGVAREVNASVLFRKQFKLVRSK